VEHIGFLAAFLTTVSFLPQVIQVVKTKETKGISLSMYVIFVLGVASWLGYGISVSDRPMIIANSITLALASLILAYKVKSVIRPE